MGRVIELFAGAGGAALGIEAAGFEHAALCELDADACGTLREAGLGPVVEGDVRDLDSIACVAGESCDVIWSSFPCQAFSTAGKRRGAQDERNGWPWTVDAIDRFKPTWFFAENVRGLVCHTSDGCGDPMTCPRCYFDAVILTELRERFECVGWWVLDAADFGVPQHRRRVIIWAGPKMLLQPAPTHGSEMFWNSFVSVANVLQFAFGKIVAAGVTGQGRPRSLNLPAPTVGTKGTAYFVDAENKRRLSVSECAKLQGFPDNHPFVGTKTSRFRQVGNAVPPILAQAVLTTIKEVSHG